VEDVPDAAAKVSEQLLNLRLAGRQPPLREKDLRIVGEQIEDAAARRGHPFVVEGFQVLQRD
jgi:hypothetical protein